MIPHASPEKSVANPASPKSKFVPRHKRVGPQGRDVVGGVPNLQIEVAIPPAFVDQPHIFVEHFTNGMRQALAITQGHWLGKHDPLPNTVLGMSIMPLNEIPLRPGAWRINLRRLLFSGHD